MLLRKLAVECGGILRIVRDSNRGANAYLARNSLCWSISKLIYRLTETRPTHWKDLSLSLGRFIGSILRITVY